MIDSRAPSQFGLTKETAARDWEFHSKKMVRTIDFEAKQ
jgi:hypothetical protein